VAGYRSFASNSTCGEEPGANRRARVSRRRATPVCDHHSVRMLPVHVATPSCAGPWPSNGGWFPACRRGASSAPVISYPSASDQVRHGLPELRQRQPGWEEGLRPLPRTAIGALRRVRGRESVGQEILRRLRGRAGTDRKRASISSGSSVGAQRAAGRRTVRLATRARFFRRAPPAYGDVLRPRWIDGARGTA
jgi:Arc/MetJ-type ribon-helix-helix transcriptional regulator